MALELGRLFAPFGLLARRTRRAEGYRTPNGAEGYGEVVGGAGLSRGTGNGGERLPPGWGHIGGSEVPAPMKGGEGNAGWD